MPCLKNTVIEAEPYLLAHEESGEPLVVNELLVYQSVGIKP